ncbi:hypothetical protein P879_01124 [Paragonimus westermani]|uniref:Dynein light chain n=1 Tax=Paragonimus westermani TaxID=34504 RepID=A0A8T0DCG3_9TREM|nr:hypothetical protein P879_01124 [Paragonimus westermani]
MAQQVAKIRKVEMPREMQERAIQVAADALERYTQDWEIGAHVREKFDNQYKPVWHCIVGRSFGGSVAYEENHFIHFYLRNRAFMLFKWG